MPDTTPPLSHGRSPIERLLTIVATLRGEQGCPWDREQTLVSLKPFLIEEAYELLDAIDSGDSRSHMDELGDVLLQVVLQSQIRSEHSDFTFDDVATGLSEKLIRRHPHVFGNETARNSDEVIQRWEAIKQQERQEKPEDTSVLGTLSRSMPALRRAQKLQERAARVGFDWATQKDVLDKIHEEWDELKDALANASPDRIEDELGDVLFSLVNLSRHLDLNAEEALDRAIAKFSDRFRIVESRLREAGRTCREATLEEMDSLWNEAKQGQIFLND
ncbi:MAG: nucleoside triphosphate pyrophosphohydrolase [Planctomycetota bacterium]|nr:nucleoside triphosphate pyrophosphohydrolase [Planctomycetota bacterium]